MPRRTIRLLLPALAVLASSCATTTEIGLTVGDEGGAEPSILAFDGGAAGGDDTESQPDARRPAGGPEEPPEPRPTEAPAHDVPDGMVSTAEQSYRIAVPEGWVIVNRAADLEAALIETSGGTPSSFEVRLYEQFLSFGDSIIVFGQDGDNLTVFKQITSVSTLGDPDGIARQLRNELRGFAFNIEISAEGQVIGGRAGVYSEGSYEVDGVPAPFHVYQFATHKGLHGYFATVTLLTGPDPELARAIFESWVLT